MFDWRAHIADTPQEAQPLPIWEDAKQAAEETQRAFNFQQSAASSLNVPERLTTPDAYAQLKMAAPIAGAYGVLDNAINFVPGVAQQLAGVPASQRKAVDLKGDFEKLAGLDGLISKYPKAYAQLSGTAELGAPMPNVGKRATFLGEVAAQGALGAGIGLASLPGQSLKAGKDITLPDIGRAAGIGFGFGGIAGGVLHGLGSALGMRAAKQGADDIATQTINGESNLDIGSVDEDILQALGLVAEETPAQKAAKELDKLLKGNIAKAEKAEKVILQKRLEGRVAMEAKAAKQDVAEFSRAAQDLDKAAVQQKQSSLYATKQELDKEMKANIAAAEARVAAIRRAQAAEAEDVAAFTAAAEGLQSAAVAKGNTTAARIKQVRAKFDSEAQAQEMLDAAIQNPLSFKKFKDGGVTWTPINLTDAKLAEFSQTLASKAEGAKGATKRALEARAEAVNAEIARRAGRPQEGLPVTKPEVIAAPLLVPDRIELSIAQQKQWDAERYAQAYLPLEVEIANNSKAKLRSEKYLSESKPVMAQELTDSQLEGHWQELAIQLKLSRTPAVKRKLETQQGIINAEVMRRAQHKQQGWRQDWTQEDGVNYSRLTDEELQGVVEAGSSAEAVEAAMHEWELREAVKAPPQPVTPEAVAVAPESFTLAQVDEAIPAIEAAQQQAPLLPTRLGTERALEGVAISELEAQGVITPEVGELGRRAAAAAYEEKRLALAKEIYREAIATAEGGKLSRKAGTGATEGQLSFTREASEELAKQRKGKDVVEKTREAHTRAIVGDGNGNRILEADVAAGLNLQRPVQELKAEVKQLTKQITASNNFRKQLQQQLTDVIGGKPSFIMNEVVAQLSDGTAVHVALEYVSKHDVKSFSDANKASQWAQTIEGFVQEGQAYLRNPVVLTPAQKAQIIAGLTTLGGWLNEQAAHAAGSGLMDATSTWASMGGTPQGIVLALCTGINPVGQMVARNILEGGALGKVGVPLSNLLLGRTIRLADNFRNTWDRVTALNKIVVDTDKNLLYQLQMTREYFQLSSHLHGVSQETMATAMHELKVGAVTPQQAALGQASPSWQSMQPKERKALMQICAIQNSIGNRLKGYNDKVQKYVQVANMVLQGKADIKLLNAFEPDGRQSKTLRDVANNLQLVEELKHSLAYQVQQVSPGKVAEGFIEKGATQLEANFNQAAFGQKNYAFQLMTVFDQLVLGNSYAGGINMLNAGKDRLANRELAQLLKSFRFVGDRAGDIKQSQMYANRLDKNSLLNKANRAAETALEGVGKLAPGYDRERVNAEELALAIIYRYYNKNKKHVGGISRQDFAKRVLKGEAPPVVVADCWNEIVTALSDVHAVNPFNLSTNILSESPKIARAIGWFAKQPAREARLVLLYMQKGDWGALATYYAMKAVVAGQAAVPAELHWLMSLGNPEGTKQMDESLDNISLYSKVDRLGTMSPKMQWGYMWWLYAGRQTPLQGAGETLARFTKDKIDEYKDEGSIEIKPEELESTAGGALAFVPGSKQLPIKNMLGAAKAYEEAYKGAEIKGYPRSATGLPFMEPVFNRRESTTVGELLPNATQADKLMYVLRGGFAPGAMKYKEGVTKDYQHEEFKELNASAKKQADVLYKFFANKVAGQ